jgi:molecular chaperone DnaK
VREYARQSEESAFDNLAKTARRAIDRSDKAFENHLDELRGKNFTILWRQDWYVVERFKFLVESPHYFPDQLKYKELIEVGAEFLRKDDIENLRVVVAQLSILKIGGGSDSDMFEAANIIKG